MTQITSFTHSSAKLLFVAIAIFSLISQRLFPQELHFFKEKIVIEINDDHCVLSGDYFFENSSNALMTQLLYYPVVISKATPFPHFWKVKNEQLNHEIPYSIGKNGISFSITIPPSDTASYSVEYHQKAIAGEFEYILMSTHSWKAPLNIAEINIDVPQAFSLQSISIPYNRVIDQKDKFRYVITRENFYPDKNLMIKWRKK